MPLTREHVVWAYRILLDREPENDDVIRPKMQAYATTRDLRDDIVTSAEYLEKNRDFAQSNERNLVIKPLESGVRETMDRFAALRDAGALDTSDLTTVNA